MMTMFVLRITALASATSCFSPALNDPGLIYISRIVGSSALGVKMKGRRQMTTLQDFEAFLWRILVQGIEVALEGPGKD